MAHDVKNALFIRVEGRKVNHCKLLESRAEELTQQVSRLQKMNQMLRAKEAMQFDMLRGYEDSMSRMCGMLVELASRQDSSEGPDAGDAVEVLSTIMLALRDSAQHLLQQLQVPAPANTTTTDQAGTACAPCDPVTRNSSSSGRPMVPCCGRHMQRLWARLTPQAVLEMRGITTRQLAARVRGDIMRMALARQCQSNGSLVSDTVEEAVLAYGETVLLAMVAADRQFLEYNLYNLERLEVEAPSQDLSQHVLSQLQLSQQQKQQLATAYGCFWSQRTSLLQQQDTIIKRLQLLMSAGPFQAGADEAYTGISQPVQACPVTQPVRASPAAGTAVGNPLSGSDAVPACLSGVLASAAAGQGRSAHAAVDNGGNRMPRVSAGHLERTSATPPLSNSPTLSRDSRDSSRSGCSSDSFNNAFSRLHVGLLDLEVAEEADRLLQQLQRIVRLNREASRGLVYVWMDVLSSDQHAEAILAAYPFTLAVASVCQLISKDIAAAAEAAPRNNRARAKRSPSRTVLAD